MIRRPAPWMTLAVASVPLVVASQVPSTTEPTAEQVFKNIQSFKGVPAKDLIPSMEFMSASLKWECTECHDPKDYAAETKSKETARSMIAMQRDINARFFNGRLEVTCMTCHNGKEHPVSMPLPDNVKVRHARIASTVAPETLLTKHSLAVGPVPAYIKFTGTQNPPFGEAQKKGEPIEMIQAADGRFLVTSASGKFGFDGKSMWRDGMPLYDEPAAIFARMGRSWRGANAFTGFEKPTVSGKEPLGKQATTVVRGTRSGTGSMEELYFDDKSGLLSRFVSVTRSTLGNVVSIYDYSHYRKVGGAQVPMNIDITFAGDEKWSMHFRTADVLKTVDESVFSLPAAK